MEIHELEARTGVTTKTIRYNAIQLVALVSPT
jgi:hypothetical protein